MRAAGSESYVLVGDLRRDLDGNIFLVTDFGHHPWTHVACVFMMNVTTGFKTMYDKMQVSTLELVSRTFFDEEQN